VCVVETSAGCDIGVFVSKTVEVSSNASAESERTSEVKPHVLCRNRSRIL
jgi:hypothetical protein